MTPGTIANLTVPSVTSDHALRIARQDAEGGGPRYVIDPEDGAILAKQYEQ